MGVPFAWPISHSSAFQAYDERILGSGDFVEQVWRETEHEAQHASPSLDEVIDKVSAAFGIEAEALRQRSKRKPFADARSALCYLATKKLGYSGAEVARSIGITRSAVVIAAARGENLFLTVPALQNILLP